MILPIIIVEHGKRATRYNAKNNPFRIRIVEYPDAGASWLGILAQELYEAKAKRAFWMLFSRSWRRDMELMGHAIECCVAAEYDDMVLADYETAEADVMTRPGAYSGMFRDMGKSGVLLALVARRQQAREWMREHRDFLNEWHAKRAAMRAGAQP